MTRTKTSKAGRRQHRGVASAPGYRVRPGLYTFNNGWTWSSTDDLEIPGVTMEDWIEANVKPFPEGQTKVIVSQRYAARVARTEALLADYRAEHDGQMPPSLYEILGEGDQP